MYFVGLYLTTHVSNIWNRDTIAEYCNDDFDYDKSNLSSVPDLASH